MIRAQWITNTAAWGQILAYGPLAARQYSSTEFRVLRNTYSLQYFLVVYLATMALPNSTSLGGLANLIPFLPLPVPHTSFQRLPQLQLQRKSLIQRTQTVNNTQILYQVWCLGLLRRAWWLFRCLVSVYVWTVSTVSCLYMLQYVVKKNPQRQLTQLKSLVS